MALQPGAQDEPAPAPSRDLLPDEPDVEQELLVGDVPGTDEVGPPRRARQVGERPRDARARQAADPRAGSASCCVAAVRWLSTLLRP